VKKIGHFDGGGPDGPTHPGGIHGAGRVGEAGARPPILVDARYRIRERRSRMAIMMATLIGP
jgi:hypothetical protein